MTSARRALEMRFFCSPNCSGWTRAHSPRRHKRYWMAANRYESCGHRHRTRRAAIPCLPKIDASLDHNVQIWPMEYVAKKKA